MSNLLEEADVAADILCDRPDFSEADLQLMFRQLQRRWHPDYTVDQERYLFDIWYDHYLVTRGAEKRSARGESISTLMKERDLVVRAAATPVDRRPS